MVPLHSFFLCTVSVVDCGPLPNPANGAVALDGTEEGNTAQYSCNAGFALVGSQTRMCGGDGQWSDTAPTCVGETVDNIMHLGVNLGEGGGGAEGEQVYHLAPLLPTPMPFNYHHTTMPNAWQLCVCLQHWGSWICFVPLIS